MFVALALALALGSVNPTVTQKNLATTICGPTDPTLHYNVFIHDARPPVSWTNNLKGKLVAQYYPGHALSEFELDHIISIEAGGAPKDPNNLRLQKWDDAHKKDAVENQMHRDICSGKVTLKQGQKTLKAWKYEQ